MKKFLFKLVCKLLGYIEVYSYKTEDNSVFIGLKRPLSKKELKEIDSYGDNPSRVFTGEAVVTPIRKSLIELATKAKKESGIVQEGNLVLEEK